VNRIENDNSAYNVARDRDDYTVTGNVCRLFGTAIGATVRGPPSVVGGGGGVSLQVGGAWRGPGGQWTDTPTFGVRRRRVSPPPDRPTASKPQLNRGARDTPHRGGVPLPPHRRRRRHRHHRWRRWRRRRWTRRRRRRRRHYSI